MDNIPFNRESRYYARDQCTYGHTSHKTMDSHMEIRREKERVRKRIINTLSKFGTFTGKKKWGGEIQIHSERNLQRMECVQGTSIEVGWSIVS